jgi:hypothetical protein
VTERETGRDRWGRKRKRAFQNRNKCNLLRKSLNGRIATKYPIRRPLRIHTRLPRKFWIFLELLRLPLLAVISPFVRGIMRSLGRVGGAGQDLSW